MHRGIAGCFRKSKGDFFLNMLIILFCLISVFPIYWLLTGSIKIQADVMKIPPDWIPTRITFDNYVSIFAENPAWRWIYNSFATALLGTLGIIIVSSGAGYSLSKLDFAGKRLIFMFVIAALVLPKEVYLLPLYQEMISFQWRGSFLALIMPDLAMPFGVFLIKQFYDTIPDELREAAAIDGCGSIRFFFDFGLPLSRPGIGALGILAFIRMWNSYLWQYTMATDASTYTLPVGIARMMDNPDIVDYGLKFAGASVAAIPLLIIFVFFQRYFTSGITAGSIKG